jgi:putative phosphoesterase
MLIGLVSDTHALVRPELFGVLAGVDLILHAGDVGGQSVLDELRVVAPVHAVYGNVDPPGDPHLAAGLDLDLGGLMVHVSHGHELGAPTPDKLLARYDADVIVFGHTHQALIHRAGPRLVVNPGAAGPRRFNVHPSIARLTIVDHHAEAEIVPLGSQV